MELAVDRDSRRRSRSSPSSRRPAAAATGDAQAAAWAALDKHAQTIANWWGVKNLSAAAFGLPVGFLVMIVVSRLTPEPSQEMQHFIEEIRIPRGKTIMEEKTV